MRGEWEGRGTEEATLENGEGKGDGKGRDGNNGEGREGERGRVGLGM